MLIIGLAGMIFSQEEMAVDSTLPGHHFSLEGALALFKEAKSPEDFEKLLNTESKEVNNLDLDQDGEIDYVRVEDHVDGDVHALILQVPISKKESQDIAVIEIEKEGPDKAILQIIGDEDVYGEQVIVEPYAEEDNGRGPSAEFDRIRVVVNVWPWASVRYIYRPSYRVYVSPFYFGVYPAWWRPWRPRPWSWFYPRHRHVHVGFHVTTTHRLPRAHRVYVPRRRTSVTVKKHHTVAINRHRAHPTVKRAGVVKTSTTVTKTGPRGGKVSATKSTTTAAAKGRGGRKAAAQRSSTSVKAQGPGGRTVKGQKTTKKAAVKGRKGKASASKTTKKATVKGKKGKATKKTTTKKVRARKH